MLGLMGMLPVSGYLKCRSLPPGNACGRRGREVRKCGICAEPWLHCLGGTSVRTVGKLVFHSHLLFIVAWYSTIEGGRKFSHASWCSPDASWSLHCDILQQSLLHQRAISTLSEVLLQNHASSSWPLTTRKLKRVMRWLLPQAQPSAKPWSLQSARPWV
jgi:hypothetical protein